MICFNESSSHERTEDEHGNNEDEERRRTTTKKKTDNETIVFVRKQTELTTKARVRSVCGALCSSLCMLHSCFTVCLLLSAMPQWCTERQCNLWELLIQNVPNWMLFHLYKTIASRTDPEANIMQASDAAGDIVRSKMFSWPSPN